MVLGLGAACLLAACGGKCAGERATPAPDTGPAVVAPEPPEHPQAPEPPPRPLAHVTRVEGDHASVAAGAALNAGDRIESGASRVVVDFELGGRVSLEANGEARLGQLAPQELLLARGIVRGSLPPSGNSPRPPLRLATSAGVVVIPGSGDVLVASLPGGRAWVAVFGGSTHILLGDVDEEGRPNVLTLVAGHALALTPAPAEQTDAPANLADALALARGLIDAAGPEGPSPSACASAQQALAQASAAHRALVARGEALRQRQRTLARTDPAQARGLLSALVDHSRQRLRSEDRVRVLAERAAVRVLGGCAAMPELSQGAELLSR